MKQLFLLFILALNYCAHSQTKSIYSKPMAEDRYWKIVAESIRSSKTKKEQHDFLTKYLANLPDADIAGFRLQTDKLLYQSYNDKLWCAAYVINGGCSDDGFQYFRCWLIAKGKAAYYAALKHPDNLVKYASDNDMENEFEEFWYVGIEAYTKKTGKDLYDALDPNFKYTEAHYPDIKMTWEEENPATMKAICPKLFAKFMGDN